LDNIDDSSVKIIFNQFLTILRQNSISDKSNAFDKMINIFIAKVLDEKNGDTQFKANGYNVNGVKFQYIENVDTEISFLKRMNDLYTQGMKEFMKKDIIDCSDEELNKVLIDNQSDKIRQIIDDLRLKKNNSFSFIEVFDDNSFSENSKILIDVVKLLQIYKFKYNNRHQYLGDFFEELLNTS
jgi:type I restriction enzyme M protein